MRTTRTSRLARASSCLVLMLTMDVAHAQAPPRAEDLLIVDCLLPGQIRQLGHNTKYLTARRPVKTTAFDCRVRHGEYVVEDRASLSTALKVWLAAAEAGDPEAQTTVGEIFERGLGVPPDHEAAAAWYRRAAEAGYARAQINLGNLYERGLGVARDSQVALSWYRRAAGLDAGIRLDTVPDVAPLVAAHEAERQRLQAALEKLESETQALRAELTASRQISVPVQAPPPAPTPVEPPTAELDSLRASVAAREREIRSLRDALAATRAQLEAASREADALRNADQAATVAREESERRRVELANALERLADRERELAARAQALEALETRLSTIEAQERAPTAADDAAVAQGLLAGPEIALIDPVLPRTRGLVKVSVPQTLDRRRIVGRVTAPAGLLSVAVNDTPAETNAAGVFVTDVAMTGAEATVAVSAIDRQGKRSDVRFVLAPSALGMASVVAETTESAFPDVDFGRYYALLIGNETYGQLPRLNTPGEDVAALDQVLRERFGFETTVVRDATRYEILSALNDMRAKLTSKDNLLVYYAGHGELDEVNMRGHWLPVDAEPDSTANWISNVTITDILNVIAAKQILLVVDSCYSGTLTRSSIAGQETTLTDAERLTWLELMANKRARVVLTSGGLAPVLDAGGGRHSVFAKALLDTLESISDVTEGQALYRSIAARVAHAAARFEFEQTPQFAPIAHAGHESGDFFLLPRRR